jgi:hypothetical protein
VSSLTFIILKTTLSNNREEIHLNTRIKNEEKRTKFLGRKKQRKTFFLDTGRHIIEQTRYPY